ncbi:MAG: carboxypeptidase-like regulatory domain-containing protein [Saprospiraceae bacterium]
MKLSFDIIFYIIFFSFSLSGLTSAQVCEGTIMGFIKGEEEQFPLEYVQVFVEQTNIIDYSDENGFFTCKGLCPGNHQLTISILGYQPKTIWINVPQKTTLNIFLKRESCVLGEISITELNQNSLIGLTTDKLHANHLTSNEGKNLANLISSLSGVSSLQTGPGISIPIIQGMYGNRIMVLNQGIPQSGQSWGLDHSPEIDPEHAEIISVIKGVAAIRYGVQALGGVVLVDDKWQHENHVLHGNLKYGFQSNGRQSSLQTSVRKAFNNFHINFKGGFLGSGDIKTPNYYLTNTGSKRGSALLSITHWLSENTFQKIVYSFYNQTIGIFKGAHVGNLTDLEEALSREFPLYAEDSFNNHIEAPKQNVQHQLLKYKFSKTLPSNTILNILAGWQYNRRKEFDNRRGGRSDNASLDLLQWSQYYEVSFTRDSMSYGSQFRHVSNINVPGTGILPLIPNYQHYNFSAYFYKNMKVKNSLVEWGVRMENRYYDTNTNRLETLPRSNYFVNFASQLGILWKRKEKIDFKANVSFVSRAPEINELFSNGLHQGVAGIEEGNPNLASEKIFKLSFDSNIKTGKSHVLNIFTYTGYGEDYIYLLPSNEIRLTIRGAYPVFRYDATEVFMAGFDLNSTWGFGNFWTLSHRIQMDYFYNLQIKNGLINIPPLQGETKLEYEIQNIRWFQKIFCGTSIQWYAKQFASTSSFDYLPPPNGYALSNVYGKFTKVSKSQNEFTFIIRIDNLFDNVYRNYLNRLRYFADEAGRNITFSFNMNL